MRASNMSEKNEKMKWDCRSSLRRPTLKQNSSPSWPSEKGDTDSSPEPRMASCRFPPQVDVMEDRIQHMVEAAPTEAYKSCRMPTRQAIPMLHRDGQPLQAYQTMDD